MFGITDGGIFITVVIGGGESYIGGFTRHANSWVSAIVAVGTCAGNITTQGANLRMLCITDADVFIIVVISGSKSNIHGSAGHAYTRIFTAIMMRTCVFGIAAKFADISMRSIINFLIAIGTVLSGGHCYVGSETNCTNAGLFTVVAMLTSLQHCATGVTYLTVLFIIKTGIFSFSVLCIADFNIRRIAICAYSGSGAKVIMNFHTELKRRKILNFITPTSIRGIHG